MPRLKKKEPLAVHVGAKVTEELKDRLDSYAATKGVTSAIIIRWALADYLAKAERGRAA